MLKIDDKIIRVKLKDDVANADRSTTLLKVSKRTHQPQPKIKQENEGEQLRQEVKT
jgi:hypothetical protein